MNKQGSNAISIVVPVHNDPGGVGTTLESLTEQFPHTVNRIFVVDNASTDETPAVVQSYEEELITLLYETDIQSSYAARNTGIRNSETELIAFLDADMTISENWLENALQTFHATETDYLACNVELTLPENPSLPARYDHHTGFPVQQYLERQHFAPTCCLFVRREVFADVGLFDPRLVSGGDKEFGNRVHDAGYGMAFADSATVYHPTRNSLRSLVTKDVRVGRGLAQLQRFYPGQYGRPGIPPRPSGIKRPDRNLPPSDRFAFGALSRFLTAARASGYARELANPT
ncbi:MAG: glycosyltransferase, partial [archaeon]